MNILNRALLNVVRNPKKNLILLLLIFFLGTLLSSAILVRNAINKTEKNLNSKLPPVATLVWNYQEAGYYDDNGKTYHPTGIEWERPTVEMITKVGNLPYVKYYDFTTKSRLISRNLEWVKIPINQELLPEEITSEELEKIQQGIRDKGGKVESFDLKGINSVIPMDIQSGLISLNSGRFMTQEELDDGTPVVVISKSLADANNLNVGSTIVLENTIYDDIAMVEDGIQHFTLYWHLDDYVLGSQSIEFNVIGIFEVEQKFYYPDAIDAVSTISRETELHNQLYVSNKVIERINDFIFEYQTTDFYGNSMTREELTNFEPIFILNDPRDLKAFSEEAKEITPEFWEVQGLSAIFGDITNAMDTMQEFAKLILWGATISTITILSLLITLFLRDRKHEIGIYMALGEKKAKVISQILSEILLIALIAIPLSLFSGNYFSNILSKQLLEKDILQQQQTVFRYSDEGIPFNLGLYNPGSMNIEEMMDSYDISLDTTTITIFFSTGIITILISTVIPIFYIVQLKPKKILM